MHIWSRIFIFSLALIAISCGTREPVTPRKTFETYIRALSKKDTAAMRQMLSSASIAMYEQEARAQGVTLDEIVGRETLFSEGQKTVELRDEKIEGETATLQVKTSDFSWETVPFVREDGVWKIDKQGYADQILKESEDSDRKLDELINGNGAPPIY